MQSIYKWHVRSTCVTIHTTGSTFFLPLAMAPKWQWGEGWIWQKFLFFTVQVNVLSWRLQGAKNQFRKNKLSMNVSLYVMDTWCVSSYYYKYHHSKTLFGLGIIKSFSDVLIFKIHIPNEEINRFILSHAGIRDRGKTRTAPSQNISRLLICLVVSNSSPCKWP